MYFFRWAVIIVKRGRTLHETERSNVSRGFQLCVLKCLLWRRMHELSRDRELEERKLCWHKKVCAENRAFFLSATLDHNIDFWPLKLCSVISNKVPAWSEPSYVCYSTPVPVSSPYLPFLLWILVIKIGLLSSVFICSVFVFLPFLALM